MNIGRSLKKFGFKIKKHSPEILVITGCAGTVASTIMACFATKKLPEVIAEKEEDVLVIDEKYATDEDYTEEDYKKDLRKIQTSCVVNVAKLYLPAVAVGALSITSILTSNNIMKKRNASLAAAYATLDSMYKRYRQNVIDQYGEEADRNLRFGIKTDKVKEKVTDENGKTKTVTNEVVTYDQINDYSDYARFFDSSCVAWVPEPETNLMFLKGVENWCNNKLHGQGYLFLNEVYRALGLPNTLAGQSVGWVYDEENPIGDNKVSFCIYDIHDEAKRAFVNGTEDVILLDFNVDGDILHNEILRTYLK